MAAKHIQIAQGKVQGSDGRTGPRAGFDAYMGGTSPLAAKTQNEIRSAGNKKAQFAAYCGKFGSQFGNAPVNTAAREPHDANERLGMVEKLVNMLLHGGNPDDDDPDEIGVVVADDEPTPATTGLPEWLVSVCEQAGIDPATGEKASKPAPKPRTPKAQPKANGEKWAPKNPDEKCSSGRLWKLNDAGLLTIRTKAGTPLTSGQAHAILSALDA